MSIYLTAPEMHVNKTDGQEKKIKKNKENQIQTHKSKIAGHTRFPGIKLNVILFVGLLQYLSFAETIQERREGICARGCLPRMCTRTLSIMAFLDLTQVITVNQAGFQDL